MTTPMLLAFKEAKIAKKEGEVPVGAVIIRGDQIISGAHNMIEQKFDCTAHAEILAIRKAGEYLSNWRLNDCDIYVSLEPCMMCAGAIIQARLRRLYFSAFRQDEISGYISSKIEVYAGIMQEEGEKILDFKSFLRY